MPSCDPTARPKTLAIRIYVNNENRATDCWAFPSDLNSIKHFASGLRSRTVNHDPTVTFNNRKRRDLILNLA